MFPFYALTVGCELNRPQDFLLSIDKTMLRKMSEGIKLDDYLCEVAATTEGHEFLGAATQGIYLRQIRFFKCWCDTNLQLQSRPIVLDWGAGKGHISYLLSKQGFEVVSCDILSEAEDSSFGQLTPIIDRNKINVLPLKHSSKLPFQDASFDAVVSFGVLEHVEDDIASLFEIRRILKPGGVFYFCFLPYKFSWTQKISHLRGNFYHDRLYSKKTVHHLAQLSSFSVEGVWHGQLFPKNSFSHNNLIEKFDRFICSYTPLRYFATNLEGLLVAK